MACHAEHGNGLTVHLEAYGLLISGRPFYLFTVRSYATSAKFFYAICEMAR